jgi:hypothetical protein
MGQARYVMSSPSLVGQAHVVEQLEAGGCGRGIGIGRIRAGR